LSIINPGFGRKHPAPDPSRVPPGQFLVTDWPVLSYGPTPHTNTDTWSFGIEGLVERPTVWSWEDMHNLPQTEIDTDIHCVTRWSKLDTVWSGVSLDALFELVGVKSNATHAVAYCDGGYTTNLPLADLVGGQAMIAFLYAGQPLTAEHGGPARLFVPHLYLWKSAKWVRSLQLLDHDSPGFWEVNGYHNHADPWKEERYSG
jgi:DMSO/TMAO reductase YedYZ molybdopterin-dependent catalytic subunit